MKKINIIVAEDHEFFRKGLIMVLNEIDFINVAGEASNGKELIDLLKTTAADIILTDIKMPVMDGIEATKIIKTLYPDIKVIVLSLHGDEEYLRKMIEIGVHGFILKNTNKEGLERALNFVKEGKQYFSEEFLPSFTKKYLPNSSNNVEVILTKRELEILQQVSLGLKNKDIAENFFISIKTVINHRTNIMSKTGTNNTASLVRYAFENKLVKL
ncbi:MAG: response regulator transcription factor [Bacteroidales bacterium]|nr:response regulator transcription factor [Bacteroidales bacterium]